MRPDSEEFSDAFHPPARREATSTRASGCGDRDGARAVDGRDRHPSAGPQCRTWRSSTCKFLLLRSARRRPDRGGGSARTSVSASTNGQRREHGHRRGVTVQVADIYFTEFNRLWGHYYFRSIAERSTPEETAKALELVEDDTWLTDKYKPGHSAHEACRPVHRNGPLNHPFRVMAGGRQGVETMAMRVDRARECNDNDGTGIPAS